jgi:hypothetical protein
VAYFYADQFGDRVFDVSVPVPFGPGTQMEKLVNLVRISHGGERYQIPRELTRVAGLILLMHFDGLVERLMVLLEGW